eukprot:TRINITY_DN445_c0_g1_i9.p2 TRINITY_DN445_c0_g1~~TRINITY_DN445_c0_g1_i9.p2  ORF type:complete len:114 (-),score=19.64 TRINITY_DN445_c0_g1_i9:260-601(-)
MTGFMANDRAPHLIKRGTTMIIIRSVAITSHPRDLVQTMMMFFSLKNRSNGRRVFRQRSLDLEILRSTSINTFKSTPFEIKEVFIVTFPITGFVLKFLLEKSRSLGLPPRLFA